MHRILITGYRLAEVSHGKSFYVYTIQVTEPNAGILYFIERRYSEFNSLHRMLKKATDTAPFPPKRVRNCQQKVLEQRRAALELYLQKMLQLSTTKQQVLEFLGIESVRQTGRMISKRMNSNTNSMTNEPDSNNRLIHHPVITFRCDPYLIEQTQTSLPDIVTQGVLLGIYKTESY